MEKEKIIRTANKYVWVEKWICHYMGKYSEWEGIVADKLPSGKWEITIKPPMIDDIITVTSNTEVGAMLKYAEIVSKALKKYLDENKDVKFPPLSKIRNWEMVSDKDGNFISVGLSSKSRIRNGQALIKMEEKCVETIEKAVQKINKICGSSRGIVIHVYDKGLLPEKLSEKEYINKEAKKVYEEINDSYTGVTVRARGQYVISIGYGNIVEERSDA